MTQFLSRVFFSTSSRKILVYYTAYSLLFLLFYLLIVSTISFFHFLLGHSMSIIENWINSHSWEILVLAKMSAAFVVLKSFQLNNYFSFNWAGLLKERFKSPRVEVLVVSIFLLVTFSAMALQFQEELVRGSARFLIDSYVGSILFVLVDFFVLHTVLNFFPLIRRRQVLFLGIILPLTFGASAKIALPYAGSAMLFMIAHYIFLLLLRLKSFGNFIDLVAYTVIALGPLTVLFGMDPVWSDQFSVYKYPDKLPQFGALLLWLCGGIYYFKASSRKA